MEPCTSWPDAIGSSQERIALRVIGTVRRSAAIGASPSGRRRSCRLHRKWLFGARAV